MAITDNMQTFAVVHRHANVIFVHISCKLFSWEVSAVYIERELAGFLKQKQKTNKKTPKKNYFILHCLLKGTAHDDYTPVSTTQCIIHRRSGC